MTERRQERSFNGKWTTWKYSKPISQNSKKISDLQLFTMKFDRGTKKGTLDVVDLRSLREELRGTRTVHRAESTWS